MYVYMCVYICMYVYKKETVFDGGCADDCEYWWVNGERGCGYIGLMHQHGRRSSRICRTAE